MKKILFISRSRLTQNLLKSVITLIPLKTNLVCLEELEELSRLPKRGKRIDLVVLDSNAFSKSPLKEAADLEKQPLAMGARKILLYPGEWGGLEGLEEAGFSCRTKPFLPEDLAHIIGMKLQ